MRYDIAYMYFSKIIKNVPKAKVIYSKGEDLTRAKEIYGKMSPEDKENLLKNIEEEAPKLIKKEVEYLMKATNVGKTYTTLELNQIANKLENVVNSSDMCSIKEKPYIKGFSKEEQETRKVFSDSVRETYLTSIGKLNAYVTATSFMTSGSQIERQTQAFLRPADLDISKGLEIMELLNNKTPKNYQQRKEFVEKRAKEFIDLANELSKPRSDKEFYEQFKDKIGLIAAIGEFQNNTCDSVIKSFGVEIDPEIKNQWKNLGSKMVSINNQINRFGYIANPQYQYMTLAEAKKMGDYFEQVQFVDSSAMPEAGLYDFNDLAFSSVDKYLAIREDENKTDNELSKAFDNLKTYYDTSTFLLNNQVQTSADLLSIRIEDENGPNCHIQDLNGNEITDLQAIELSNSGKRFIVCDEQGNFKQFYDKNTVKDDWGCIREKETYKDIDIKNSTPEEIKAHLKDFLDEADKGTHWYMKSSNEYRNMRNSIKDLMKADLTDKKVLEDGLKEISKNAKDYLLLKEAPNAKITSRTDPRISAAEEIFKTINNSFTKANEVQLVNENGLTKEQEEILKNNQAELQRDLSNEPDICQTAETNEAEFHDQQQEPACEDDLIAQ